MLHPSKTVRKLGVASAMAAGLGLGSFGLVTALAPQGASAAATTSAATTGAPAGAQLAVATTPSSSGSSSSSSSGSSSTPSGGTGTHQCPDAKGTAPSGSSSATS